MRFGARPGNVRLEGEIVGIVGDVHDQGLDQGLVPEFYASLEQAPVGAFSVVLRTTQDPGEPGRGRAPRGAGARRRAPGDAARADGARSSRARSRGPRFTMSLLLAFAATALLLSAVGIYGVTAYAVSQRTRELGIRMALGRRRAATCADSCCATACASPPRDSASGSFAALALTRLLRGLLFEVPPTDLATHAGVALILLAVVLAACWIPARRAARLDPWRALRAE